MNLEQFLTQRRDKGAPIILDGAVGTELERRGFAIDSHPLWSVRALNDREGKLLLSQIHADYAEAGADILTANTFRVNPRLLERHGLLNRGAELVEQAVTIARNAASGKFIAGSISPLESCYTPSLVPENEILKEAHQQTAAWMKQAEVDLVIIETMTTIRETEAALEGVMAQGLPVVVSFCCDTDGRLLGGESLKDAIGACAKRTLAIAVNCVALSHLDASLRILCDNNPGESGFYANLGILDARDHWHALNSLTPEVYATFSHKWYQRGVRWIGACCGSKPDHIRALSRRWQAEMEFSS